MYIYIFGGGGGWANPSPFVPLNDKRGGVSSIYTLDVDIKVADFEMQL